MLGAAVLPSILHQDPRYFYQGSGSIGSRAWHALSSAFICRGDNGNRQFNFSHILGNFAAGGISNLYRPDNDRVHRSPPSTTLSFTPQPTPPAT